MSFVQQVEFYPVTDANFDTPSYEEFADGYFLTRDAMKWYWDQFTTDENDRAQITASPLRASVEQLEGLPLALIINGEADVLRDEGEAFAAKLHRAKVPVTNVRYGGMIHDFVMLNALHESGSARAAVALASTALISTHAAPSATRRSTNSSTRPLSKSVSTTCSAPSVSSAFRSEICTCSLSSASASRLWNNWLSSTASVAPSRRGFSEAAATLSIADNGRAARDLRFGVLPWLTRIPLQLLPATCVGRHPIEVISHPGGLRTGSRMCRRALRRRTRSAGTSSSAAIRQLRPALATHEVGSARSSGFTKVHGNRSTGTLLARNRGTPGHKGHWTCSPFATRGCRPCSMPFQRLFSGSASRAAWGRSRRSATRRCINHQIGLLD